MKDPNELLVHLHCGTIKPQTVLTDADEAYFCNLVADVRKGRRAIVITEQPNGSLSYMFSHASRGEAISIMGRVLSATGAENP